MASFPRLPAALRDRLAAVARRIRFLRMIHGLSVLLLVLTLTGAACLAADFSLQLDAFVRFGLLAGWLMVGGVTALLAVVLPPFRRLDPQSLAAVVEEQYPELAERLLSAVELSGERAVHHGSPALIDLLVDDTTRRTSRLNLTRAVPAGLAVGLAVLALVLLTGVLSPATVWPDQYGHLTQRFFAPWYTPPVVLDYEVSFQEDVIAARGRPLVLTARIILLKDEAVLPADGTLVLTDTDGRTERRPLLAASDAGLFRSELGVLNGNLSCHVESGLAKGNTFTVTAVEPVSLAPDSPKMTVTAPDYARVTQPETTHTGLVNLTALQHSQVQIEAALTQPARLAFLLVSPTLGVAPGTGQPSDPGVVLRTLGGVAAPIKLTDDGLRARVDVPAQANGQFQLVFFDEHNISTVVGPCDLTVRVDQPPAFHKVTLSDQLKAVLPNDQVPLEFSVVDDVGVAGALVEYQVNNGDIAVEPIPLTGANTVEAKAKHFFALSGKVKEGDAVRLRLKAMDNRRLPEMNLGPQEVYHPAKDRWVTFKVASQARPLQEQEILGQRDDVNKKLDKIKQELLDERQQLADLRKKAKDDNAPQLKQLRQDHRTTEDELRELARDAAANPELQKVADAAQDVADQEMRKAAEELRQAEKGQPREEHLKKADDELAQALQKVEAMRKANDLAAQQRLDQMKLEMAAQKQQDLANRTGDLADKGPDAARQAQDLHKEQGDLAKELDKLAEQSDALRNAFDAARGEQAKELADKARELAKQQRELAQEGQKDDPARQEKLAELARKQQELVEKAAKLAKETQQAARAAQTTPFKPDDAQKAVDNLKQGDAGEAVKNQDQTARNLDKLAEELDRAIDLAKDPREAAQQLARMQQALQQKLAEELAKKDDKKPLLERLAELQKEQDALRKAAEQLAVPDQNKQAQADQRNAVDQAAQAAQALKSPTARTTAPAEMEQSRKALEQLAKELPSLDQRVKAAREEATRLRQQQEAIDLLAQQATKAVEKDDPNAARTRQALAEQLTQAMRKQAEMAERLSKLDAPGHEARQEKAEQALNQALRDLMDARPQDIPASQQAARRALERLEQELAGKVPADEQARLLAEKQKQLADEAAKAARQATPQQLAELQKKQQELAQQTQNLPAPEAPQGQRDAAQATKQAEQSANADPVSPESLKKMQEAAKALEKLAELMGGQESDAAKADRLARQQAEAADEADRLRKKQPAQPPSPEALKKQQQLAQELKETRAGEEAQAEKQKALESLKRAQQAKPEEQAQAQRKAADAVKDFADKLAGRKEAQARPADQPQKQDALKPTDSPRQLARQLAEKQRDLIRQTQKARDDVGWFPDQKTQKKYEETLKKINDQQQLLNKQASQIPADGQQRTLEQAREAMNQASQYLDKKDAYTAQGKQQDAVNLLDRLARNLPEKAPPPAAQADQQKNQGPLNQQQGQQARELAQQQRDLRDAVQKMAQQPAANQAEQQAKQQDLEKQGGELMKQLQQLAEQMKRSPPAQQQTEQAQQAARQAQELMKQAQQQADQGNQGQKQQAQQQAAQSLEKAAQQARQAGEKMQAQPQPGQQAGQAVQDAQGQMQQAQKELGQGQPQPAQNAMQKAVEALKQAAQQLGQKPGDPNQPGQPTPTGEGIAPSGEGRVDGSLLGPDMKQYAGKRWGELPGELQTKILQDMKARYGDDYARIIKLYFEQLADTKRK